MVANLAVLAGFGIGADILQDVVRYTFTDVSDAWLREIAAVWRLGAR